MGGFGSGYHGPRPGARDTVEETERIDVRRLHKLGQLTNWVEGEILGPAVWHFKLGWVRAHILGDGFPAHGVDLSIGRVREGIGLDWTPALPSRWRPWFRCPRCFRRCRYLHIRRG